MKQILSVSAAMVVIILIVGWQTTGAEKASLEGEISQLGILHNVSVDGMSERSVVDVDTPQLQVAQVVPFRQITDELTDAGITAEVAVVQDLESGQILFERDSYSRRQLASITKLMTAVVVMENYNWGSGEYITMTPTAFATYGGNSLLIGESFQVEDLMKALLMVSSNDAATLLAEHFGGGSEEEFIRMMNAKAQELSMDGTQFRNPHGLDDPQNEHFSTGSDVMALTRYVYNTYPELFDIMMIERIEIQTSTGRPVLIGNTSTLLNLPGMRGGKTGLTDAALETFTSVVEIQGRAVGITVLRSGLGGFRFTDTAALRDWVDTNFRVQV